MRDRVQSAFYGFATMNSFSLSIAATDNNPHAGFRSRFWIAKQAALLLAAYYERWRDFLALK
jgi:hypothetical protein